MSQRAEGERTIVVVGQCAYTGLVIEQLVKRAIIPAQVILSTRTADRDPFAGLALPEEKSWARAHRFYHGGWLERLRLLCKVHAVPLERRPHPFSAHLMGATLLVAGLALRVPNAVLDQFGAAALNAHTSLLPSFAGPQPEAQAILHESSRSGITIHSMTPVLDGGPIRYQAPYAIPQGATVGALEARGAILVARGMAFLLSRPPAEWPCLDPENERSYYSWQSDSVLDLATATSLADAERRIRLRPEGYAFCDCGGRRLFPIALASDQFTARLSVQLPWGDLFLREWVERPTE